MIEEKALENARQASAANVPGTTAINLKNRVWEKKTIEEKRWSK